MKKIISILCLSFVFSTMLLSQNIEKSYTSSVRGEETVYFIYPMKKFKSINAPKELEYDITYNHTQDSITYNFTFFYKEPFSCETVLLKNDDTNINVSAKMLFIEPKKDLWIHRVSLKIPYDTFKTFYSSSSPYEIIVNKGTENITFNIKSKDWDKQASIFKRIMQVIELNKK